MRTKTKSLMEATGHGQVCKLEYDNIDAGDFWLIYDGAEVTIAGQKLGEEPTQKISVPIREFRKLVKAFVKQQNYGR